MSGLAELVDERLPLPKASTGIPGLDEVTAGGLPRGRSTLVCGPAGSGKTILALEFLVRGILLFDEPGVFLAFEESPEDLTANVASFGYHLDRLRAEGKLVLDRVSVSYGDIEEAGDWDLDGLLLRLGAAIDAVGARRVVIDTIENLFGALTNTAVLRSELHRLFRWLKDRGVTAVITGERGDGELTRHGIEEYVSDCVIVLDHRVVDQSSTRRLRVVKYRGSIHGTNEYPFLIGDSGVSVLPITSLRLQQQQVSTERMSTGVPQLDAMLGDGGFYRASAILVSGSAGTGKSTLGARFCEVACARGERALYFAFEEAQVEIVRNMQSVGTDLTVGLEAGLLQFRCSRPSRLGLEAHLLEMQQDIREFRPSVVVIDPVSDLLRIGTEADVVAMLTRQLDFLKNLGITTLFTDLDTDGHAALGNRMMASLVDTWLVLQSKEGNGEHNRLLHIRKSRGMAHSNQIRELLLTGDGIDLAPVYVGPNGVLTGSARRAQEARERTEDGERQRDLEARRRKLARLRESVEVRTAALWRRYEQQAASIERDLLEDSHRNRDRAEEVRMRGHDPVGPVDPPLQQAPAGSRR